MSIRTSMKTFYINKSPKSPSSETVYSKSSVQKCHKVYIPRVCFLFPFFITSVGREVDSSESLLERRLKTKTPTFKMLHSWRYSSAETNHFLHIELMYFSSRSDQLVRSWFAFLQCILQLLSCWSGD